VIANVIKLSKALAEIPRKVGRGLASPRRRGGDGWDFIQVMSYRDLSIPLIDGDTKHFMAYP